MPRSRLSDEALAEARHVVTRADLFISLFPDEAADLRRTAWEMLKEDHAARLRARRVPFPRTEPGDAA